MKLKMKRRMMMNDFLGVCLYLASIAEPLPNQSRVDTCLEVAKSAIDYKIDPFLALALSYHESRFDKKVVSKAGAIGALQVKRRFIDCSKCTDIEAGLLALRYWIDRTKSTCEALGKYTVGNAGKCGKRSRMIIRLSKELNCRHSPKDYCQDC